MSYPLFNQTVQTPKGPATYIGQVYRVETRENGEEVRILLGVQVARRVPVIELTKEERERINPSIKDMDRETLAAWLKSSTILVNEIYPADEVKA